MSVVQKAFTWGPLWFGLGFIAPLVAQSMEAAGLSAPFGMSEIAFGLAIGAVLGATAKRRGSWV